MTHSPLLVKPSAPDAVWRTHHITPKSARWDYVGFTVCRIPKGETLTLEPTERELCLVLVAGVALVGTAEIEPTQIGERMSPFDGKPWAFYAPAGCAVAISTLTDVELAICSAPGAGGFKPRVIAPDEKKQLQRGTGTNTRYPYNILPEDDPAHSLLVVEVITPGGHWSSYPPHKHDRNAPPEETYLEETYYHRFNRPGGFALQRVYTDDGSIDETLAASDGDVVLVPKGYHPVGAPHGFDLYYLNVMAGPVRAWNFHVHPDYRWIAGMTSAPAAR